MKKPLPLWIQISIALMTAPLMWGAIFYGVWRIFIGAVTRELWQPVVAASVLQLIFVGFAYWRGTDSGIRARGLAIFVTVLGVYLMAFVFMIGYFAEKFSLLSASAVRYCAFTGAVAMPLVIVAVYFVIKPIYNARLQRPNNL